MKYVPKGVVSIIELEVEYAKDNKQVYPFYDETGTIRLKWKNSSKGNDLCLIHFDDEASTSIYIEDIQIDRSDINKGYGSAAFRALVKHAISNNVKKITGMISSVDYDHIDRLEHFYKKHFCEVTINHEKKGGRLKLDLSDPEKMLLKIENQVINERVSYLQELTEKQKNAIKYRDEKIREFKMEIENESWLVKFLKKRSR